MEHKEEHPEREEHSESKFHQIWEIIEEPATLTIAVILGLLIGTYLPVIGEAIDIFSEPVDKLLKMCIPPIIITTIALSIADFHKIKGAFQTIISSYILIFLAVGFLGILTASVLEPAKKIDITKSPHLSEIQKKAAQITREKSQPIEPQIESSVTTFLRSSVPSNIFNSLASSKNIQIVIFSIILGLTLNFIKTSHKEIYRSFLNSISTIFTKIFSKIKKVIPLLVVALIAAGVSNGGLRTLKELLNLVAIFWSSALFIIFITLMTIKWRAKQTLWTVIQELLTPMTIAFATGNTIAAIPSINEVLIKKFKFDAYKVEFLSSFGLVLFRFGMLLYFSFIVIFVAEIYNLTFTPYQYYLIVVFSALATFASTGMQGEFALAMLSVVLTPLGIPTAPVLVILLYIDDVINPIRLIVDVLVNCAAISIISKKTERKASVTP